MATSPTVQLSAEAAVKPPTPVDDTFSSASSSTKRKRGTELKFYAVRTGHAPGIYHSWEDCKKQITGFKKSMYKSFTSLTEAEAFMNNEASTQTGTPSKYYAVQNGRVPGVYTDWPSAQKQITGWTKPKHKSFTTRAEAEAFVKAGPADGHAVSNVLIDPDTSSVTPSAFAESSGPPAAKKARTTKKETASLTNGDPTTVEPSYAPLPWDAEDGFDPRQIMDIETGMLRWKTEPELNAKKLQVKPDNYADSLQIWTDGACKNNGQKNSIAGVGVYFGPKDPRNVSEPLFGTRQTNQRAELTALKRALDICPLNRNAIIFSDSSYSINCVTTWFVNWRKNNWQTASKKPVENKDLIEQIVSMVEERNLCKVQTKFTWIKGHADDPGNVAADRLAVQGAEEARAVLRMEARTEIDAEPDGAVRS